MPELPLEKLVLLLSSNPRRIFDLERNTIDINANACLTLFLPEEIWTVKTLQTKSKNSPFVGKELTGKAIGIINKDKLFLNEY